MTTSTLAPSGAARWSAYEILISIFVVAILLLQAATVGDRFFHTRLGGRKLWPILSYLMYDDAHYDGETIKAYYPLEGTLKDGSVVQITWDTLGLSFWNYLHLGDSLAKDDPTAVKLFLKLYKQADDLTELRVKTLPLMITRTGQAYKAPTVVRAIPVDAALRAQAAQSPPLSPTDPAVVAPLSGAPLEKGLQQDGASPETAREAVEPKPDPQTGPRPSTAPGPKAGPQR